MNNEHDIETLNSLIETTLDSADGYAEAAKDAQSGTLNSLFRARSGERRTAASMLQQCVRLLGGKPGDGLAVDGASPRMFADLRARVSSADSTGVVDSVERGEAHIRIALEDAMNDRKLSPHTMTVIEDVYTSMRYGHVRTRLIKQALHAAGGQSTNRH
ncbi:MAG: PA2169 family four-helix-bundle protein [Rhodanobacter sp.]